MLVGIPTELAFSQANSRYLYFYFFFLLPYYPNCTNQYKNVLFSNKKKKALEFAKFSFPRSKYNYSVLMSIKTRGFQNCR